ncbi:FAD-binding oxidoreductase [Synechococcus sp. Nb3U1]|uniref:NAD(P)/FAD-dependent oxidoreductase n=1 Tax=Synechococcus sp. Nb3U1 TaxID=1914529 RepID=UPI001F1851A0|nr:FAD-dependent oxidoreductase [Synechococcus sp. Nb3U1]MCF2969769.1 FAD-binding oxidoreductase [Synechococcus sp. Nb3U1]
MANYDWIVIGGGITGAALSYELAHQGGSVLLVEKEGVLNGATRYSYGGLAHWAGKTPLLKALGEEGIQRYRTLSGELQADIQFRELDLLMPIAPGYDADAVEADMAQCRIPPRPISVEAACELEPLLDPAALERVLWVSHGHINPFLTALAFQKAFQRLGGSLLTGTVTGLRRQGDCIVGVEIGEVWHGAAQVVVCAGGWTRALLRQAGIRVPIYFTHAESVELEPSHLKLNALVMSTPVQRFELEQASTRPEQDPLWDEPGQEPCPPILDAGVLQFVDGSLRMGQISRVLTDPNAVVDSAASEAQIREQAGRYLPKLAHLPGQWYHCLVAFSGDQQPLVGSLPGLEGLQLFSGFSNPLAVVPVLARRFAQQAYGQEDEWIPGLSPGRFADILN